MALRFGGNSENIRMELAFDAMISKPTEGIAAHMRTLYHDGNGFQLDGRRFSVWYDTSGIRIAAGDRARYANNAQIISWTDAAKRFGELIEAGQFSTHLENVEATERVRRKVAERLVYMNRDRADNKPDYLPIMPMDSLAAFQDSVDQLTQKMEQPEFLNKLIRQLEVFTDAVTLQPDLMSSRFSHPRNICPDR